MTTELACVLCVAQFEHNELERPRPAFVIYKGETMCSEHFNTARGHGADFIRYPVTEVSGDE